MKVTVFTPTYNRAYIIHNLYESLKRQSCKDFEWLVVDDGSSDGTEAVFSKWQKEENGFPIRYYKQPNGGKHRAINRGLDLAEGELFFTVDSDDYLTDDAIGKIKRWSEDIPEGGKYCGIAGSDGDRQKTVANPTFVGGYIDATLLNRYSMSGMFIGYDRPWVFFTEIHKKYRYPEFKEEMFVAEAVAWNRMAADGYHIRCYNDVIYLREHQADGLTNGIRDTRIKNPWGYGLLVKEEMDFLEYACWERIIRRYAFYCELCHTYQWWSIAGYIQCSKAEMFLYHSLYWLKHGR